MREPKERAEQKEKVLKSLEVLKESQHFINLLEYLADELVDQRERNDVLQGVKLAWGQGEAQRLNTILTMVDDNLSELLKVKERRVRSTNRHR